MECHLDYNKEKLVEFPEGSNFIIGRGRINMREIYGIDDKMIDECWKPSKPQWKHLIPCNIDSGGHREAWLHYEIPRYDVHTKCNPHIKITVKDAYGRKYGKSAFLSRGLPNGQNVIPIDESWPMRAELDSKEKV